MLRLAAPLALAGLLLSAAPAAAHAQAVTRADRAAAPPPVATGAAPVPIGTPLALLLVPAALIFLPGVLGEV